MKVATMNAPEPNPRPAPIVLDYASPGTAKRNPRWDPFSAWLSLFAAIFALLGSAFPAGDRDATIVLFALLWLPSTTAGIISVIALRGTADPISQHKRKLYVITCWIALASLVLSIRYDHCPHARYFGVGPFEFTQGRACSNPRENSNLLTVWFRGD